ncbi:MAG: GTP cyclohydrolase MptA [Solirubrobacterales bacterium]|nr:GTP cyclohydrolase MptA [Solirubrobacterales bacterium]
MNPEIALSPNAVDVQSSQPATRVSLSRVGVTGVEKVISIGEDGHYHAELECYVDLSPDQAGAHMSRFEENVSEAIEEVVRSQSMRAEQLAARIAELVRVKQKGLRAEVSINARYAQTMPAPVSGIENQEIYNLLGTAVASPEGTRTVTGVQAQGMTACPCAQGMVADLARTRLRSKGYDEGQVEEIIEEVPIATHNQRGLGTLWIGCTEGGPDLDARDMLRLVESSMSSEIYELMKRPDEMSVVVKAHSQPRFVEDCVREMIRQVLETYPGLADDAFVMARQENLETIHRHNVVAERFGQIADLRREVEGENPSRRHLTMKEWLEGP